METTITELIDKINEMQELLRCMQTNAKQQEETKETKGFIEYTTNWQNDLKSCKQTAIKAEKFLIKMDTKITQDIIRAKEALYDNEEAKHLVRIKNLKNTKH